MQLILDRFTQRTDTFLQVTVIPKSEMRVFNAVYEYISKEICSGRYKPGSPLSESSVARKLEVSRTPVHEAMRQLEKDGLIEQKPNCRPTVVNFSINEFREIFDMRLLLEGEAASLAALTDKKKFVPYLLRQLKSLERYETKKSWSQAWVKHDNVFHFKIAQASGNNRLFEEIEKYRSLSLLKVHQYGIYGYAPFNYLKRAKREHEAVLTAIAAGKENAARKAICAHICNWKNYFVERLIKESKA